jgi:hypothetical protein
MQDTWTGLGLTADAMKWIFGTGICNAFGVFELVPRRRIYFAETEWVRGLAMPQGRNRIHFVQVSCRITSRMWIGCGD